MTSFRALLVGNARFPRDPHNLHLLKGPPNDVDALHDELTNTETGIFQCQQTLKDASARELLDAISEFFNGAGQDDTLLFYYSGHGRVDVENDFYLCARDTETQILGSPRISGPDLSKIVRNSPARLKIIILDCCYANEFKGEVWAPKYFRGEGRFVLAATRSGSPLVPDATTPIGLSPFTERLVEALRRNDLDADGDGLITAHEVADYITKTAARRRNAPFALQQWTGTGIVPIARSAKRRPGLATTAAERVEVGPPSIVGDQPLPELVSIPPRSEPSFWLSRTLVTNGQFRGFLNDPANAVWWPETARRADRVPEDYLRLWQDNDFSPELETHPVVNVTVEGAMAYLEWAGQRLGRVLRLPHESEWLQGARADRIGDWHIEDARAGLVNYYDTLAEPTEVGEFHANPYGVFDLLGQVWEICSTDIGEPVLRGGAFNTPLIRLLERWTPPIECRSDVGFRCASDGEGR